MAEAARRPPHLHDVRQMVAEQPRLQVGLRNFRKALLPLRSGATRVVYFLGDSTARNLFDVFSVALESLGGLWSKGTDNVRVPCAGRCPGNKSGSGEISMSIVEKRWFHAGYHASRLLLVHGSMVCVDARVVSAVRARLLHLPPPTTIVVSAGLWNLWPVPFAKGVEEWTTFRSFRRYEQELARMYRACEALSRETLFLTTHPICEREMVADGGLWGRVARAHAAATSSSATRSRTGFFKSLVGVGVGRERSRARPPAPQASAADWHSLVMSCASWLQQNQRLSGANESSTPQRPLPSEPPKLSSATTAATSLQWPLSSMSDNIRHCTDGSHTADGSRLLNERLRASIDAYRARSPQTGVRLVDTYSLLQDRCAGNKYRVPNDFIHFHLGLYDELALVLKHAPGLNAMRAEEGAGGGRGGPFWSNSHGTLQRRRPPHAAQPAA